MKLNRHSMGKAIKTIREAAKMTLSDLAQLTGITVSSLSRSELGARDLSYFEFAAIARAFEVDQDLIRELAEHIQMESMDISERTREIHRLQIATIAAYLELKELATA